jgi:hypothetical protein
VRRYRRRGVNPLPADRRDVRNATRPPYDSGHRNLFATFCLALAASSCAPSAATPTSSAKTTFGNQLSLLLDVASDREANVVAIIEPGGWRSAALAGGELLRRVAKRGARYRLLPSLSATTITAPTSGELSGSVREECFEFYVGLAGPSPAHGFAVVGASESGRPLPVEKVQVEPAHIAAVSRIIEQAAGTKLTATIEHAYRTDLDGNKKPEVILQATHPELAGDPPEYKPEYYSLIVVLPDDPAAQPVFTGYLQATQGVGSFQVVSLEAVADLDLDGKPELLVRARHTEGWQTQVFRYRADLENVFRSVGGEGECPEVSE